MKLRPATLDDVRVLAAAAAAQPLMQRYGTGAEALERGLRQAVDAGDGVVVADDDGPVGFAWYQLTTGLGIGGYLKLIALAPGSEGRGVGGTLLDEVERAVRVEKKHLFLLVSQFNSAAQRFYERRGFERVGQLERLVHPDIDELLYIKRL